MLLLLTPEYSGINKEQRIADRSKTAHRKPPVKCFLKQFGVIHTVEGFGIGNEAEVDVSLELSCYLYDPRNVGNLVSGSSAFSKSSLNIWEF